MDIEALKERFRQANAEELKALDREIDELQASNPIQFEENMLLAIKQSNKEAEEIILR